MLKRRELWVANEAYLKKALFDLIKPIVDKHDPLRILKLGASLDEYDPESQDIADNLVQEALLKYCLKDRKQWKNLSHDLSEKGITNLVTLVWHIHFGCWTEKIQYRESLTKIAKEIHFLLPEVLGRHTVKGNAVLT